jgi:hypothetical protein
MTGQVLPTSPEIGSGEFLTECARHEDNIKFRATLFSQESSCPECRRSNPITLMGSGSLRLAWGDGATQSRTAELVVTVA